MKMKTLLLIPSPGEISLWFTEMPQDNSVAIGVMTDPPGRAPRRVKG